MAWDNQAFAVRCVIIFASTLLGISIAGRGRYAANEPQTMNYSLSPTELFSTLMVTSGTMTHRLKRLESRGLISRQVNANDARSMLVQLTHDGMLLIDRAVEKHVENEKHILSGISAETLGELDRRLADLLRSLDGFSQQ